MSKGEVVRISESSYVTGCERLVLHEVSSDRVVTVR